MNFSLSTVLNTLVGSSLFAAIAVLLICRCTADRGIKLYTVFFLCAAAMRQNKWIGNWEPVP